MSSVGSLHQPVSGDSPWIRRYRRGGAAVARLVCFPHAGGGASVFGTWSALLPGGVELVAVQLPGREGRYDEPPPDDLPTLLDELAAALEFTDGVPSTFFGHSWGAMLAFELARRFECAGGPAVAHLVASGARAPHYPPALPPLSHLPRDELLAGLNKINGIHPDLLKYDDYLDLVLPTLRADLRMVERYRHVPGAPLRCPITVFGGEDDPMTPPETLQAWRDYTSAGSRLRMFPGDHFFYVDNRALVTAALGAIVA